MNRTWAGRVAPIVLSMDPPDGMSRARREVEAGRLWKARDRLNGVFSADPSNQEVLELLGEVYFRMGDLPQAGRYWYLTVRRGEDAEIARDAFEERFGRSVSSTAESLPVQAPVDGYPEEVQERLGALIEHLEKTDKGAPYRWLAHGVHTRWVTGEAPGPRPPGQSSQLVNLLGVAAFVGLTIGVWVIGVVALVWFLGTRLFG